MVVECAGVVGCAWSVVVGCTGGVGGGGGWGVGGGGGVVRCARDTTTTCLLHWCAVCI